ncbi:MAG TPA: indole-3-glycerol phosphate synthase TrpC [Planctomycetota bacterium]|nr:indole-3-glycerol phosphate synthase TrpC [Planctomycetota bacterium]
MILDEIVTAKKSELRRSKDERKIAELKAKARNAQPVPAFDLRVEGSVSIVAEVKRASPVKGVFKADLDPAKQARAYREGGARAISVLTDAEFFKGSVEDLRAARDASGLPVLRKDFVIDDYQLWEAKVMRASAALLIVRILDRAQLRDYIALAREELKIAALVEVHTEKELEAALDAKASIVGINNRDLDTFKVTLETTARLMAIIPAGTVTVSESGISTREDIVLLGQMKVDAALIGEELVKAADPAARIRELLGVAHAG